MDFTFVLLVVDCPVPVHKKQERSSVLYIYQPRYIYISHCTVPFLLKGLYDLIRLTLALFMF